MARSLSEHFDSITSDGIESIDPLLSDCCFSIPPSSAPRSQLTAPVTTEPLPFLKRVGPQLNHIAEHPRWGKRGLTSEVWQYFEQGAEIKTGYLCVSCKSCGLILTYLSRNGTNAILRYRERYLPKGKQRQGNIKVFINSQVRQK
ncbi:uncharacterized protein N7477_009536 [Penicillium maclennaniae]|uniref:uncharacterized protein n=1 Tax=Penicillium maclennaniae TaxID=1343394 RepID=UPI00254015AE|nr:uncharacterized protein N7477_009536 [Penicillium maclennaniae]KAJ5661920.1 hypothetical protein N7477_009536 [Penicillium maclennaniae]